MVDNSSAFRMEDGVPLVVPEVNPEAAFKPIKGVIANPNCTTILLTLALAPLAARRAMRRVVVSTYQSASGAGAQAMEELKNLSQTVLLGRHPSQQCFPIPLLSTCFFTTHRCRRTATARRNEDGERDTQDHGFAGSALYRHLRASARAAGSLEAVNVEFEPPSPFRKRASFWLQLPGAADWRIPASNRFPMPTDVAGRDPVMIGRIREDISEPNALELWLCGDQIRKGGPQRRPDRRTVANYLNVMSPAAELSPNPLWPFAHGHGDPVRCRGSGGSCPCRTSGASSCG